MKRLFSQFFYSVEKDFKENILKVAIIISLLAVVYLLSENIFLSFVIAAVATVVLLGWDGRIFFGFGLIFLIFCPFLLAFEKKLVAEEMAVYAYYMLALGVLLQMVEYIKHSLSAHTRVKRTEVVQEVFTKRNFLLFSMLPAFLVFVFSAGAFYFFYSKMNQKLDENTKVITRLIEENQQKQKESNKEDIQEKPLTVKEEVVSPPTVVVKQDPPMDWEKVLVFVENRTAYEGLEQSVAEKFKQLGVINITASTSTVASEEITIVEYCSTCLNIAQELLSGLENADKLLIVETPELGDQIVVRLGTDQHILSEDQISISLLNGSRTAGALQTIQTKMKEKGFQIVESGDALKKDYTKTVIKYSSGNNLKADMVKSFLSNTYREIELQEDTTLPVDVEVILAQV